MSPGVCHSPGPWNMTPGPDADRNHLCRVEAACGRWVASVRSGLAYFPEYEFPMAEALANARLVVAGPELLLALRVAEAKLTWLTTKKNLPGLGAATRQATAAILKATLGDQ